MSFIDHEQQPVILVHVQPRFRVRPNLGLNGTKEHVFKHGVIRDEYIGCELLHLKARNQFRVVVIGYVFALVDSL